MAAMSAQSHPYSYGGSPHWDSANQAPGHGPGPSSSRNGYPKYKHPYADQRNYEDEDAYAEESVVVAPDLRVTAPSRAEEERRPDSILSDDRSVYSERMSTTTLSASAPQTYYSSVFKTGSTNPSHHFSALSTQSDLSRESWQGNARPDSNVDPFSFMKYESPRQQLPKVVVSSPSDNSFQRQSQYEDDDNAAEAVIPQLITPPPFQPPQGRVPSAVQGTRNFSRPTRSSASTSTPDLSTTQQSPGRPPVRGSEEKKKEVLERNRQRLGQGPSYSQPTSPNTSLGSSYLPSSSSAFSQGPYGYVGSHSGGRGDEYMAVPNSRSRSPSPSRSELAPVPSPSFPQSSTSSSASSNLSPTTPQGQGGLVPLPSNHPGMRVSTPESVYSVYSYYNLDNNSSEGSPASPSFEQSKTPESNSDRSSTNTNSLTPPGSATLSKDKGKVHDLPTDPKTAEDYLTLGIAHHEADRLTESAECFEKSATFNGGCAVGMLMWGLSLRHGWGVPKNEQRAFKWLKRAAEIAVVDLQQGRNNPGRDAVKKELVLAVYEVGQCFFQGWGVPKDKAMGVSYFQTAAQLGDPDAQQDLAFCLANGKGCKKDRKAAAKWYRAAAEQGASTVGLAWIYKPKYQE